MVNDAQPPIPDGHGRGRFRAPQPVSDHLPRTALDDRYAAARGKVVRVLAPAGYGKTSLASRWAAAERRDVRWVDVEEADDDPIAMLDTLRQALSGIVDVPPASLARSGGGDPCTTALAHSLADVPDATITPFVLVLDDVHRVVNPAAGRLIDVVAEHLPRSSTLVLVGRAHHDHGSVGRLRVDPGLIDVTVEDLSLDASTSRRLLRSMGVDLPETELARVVELLEGWPAGLLLAGRAMSGRPPGASAAADVADHVAFVDYLRGEWTNQLGDEDFTFLREIACLERFSGEMCDRVLGRTGSGELLQRLHRDQLVVFPLDRRGEWYRLHPLLSRWLSADLRGADPERWRRIHADAARYWEDQGEIDLAIAHARLAGDLQSHELLVATHGGRFFARGMDSTVQRWLDGFPTDHVRRSPALCGLSAIGALHTGDGDRAVQWQRLLDRLAVEHNGPESDASEGSEATRCWPSILHAATDRRPAGELLPLVEGVRDELAGGAWAGFAHWVRGALSYVVGDLDRAAEALDEARFEAELVGTPLITAHCLGTEAIIDEFEGHRASAASKAERAAAVLHDCHGELLTPTAPILAMSALRHARDGRRAEAARRVTATRRAITGFERISPWFNVITRLALVRTTLVLDDRGSSLALARELAHHSRFEDHRRGAIAHVAELCDQVAAMHDRAAGARGLTDAELGVLRLLPTNLSLADIGARLFVSRNTVKSHAASIYRKLGVGSRSEAVEAAHEAGLLSGVSLDRV